MNLLAMGDRQFLAHVAARPGMFVVPPTFGQLAAFLTGYDLASQRCGRQGLAGFDQWLVARRGKDCSRVWWVKVLHIALPDGFDTFDLSDEQEARATTVLFELIDQFLAERDGAR